jgi:uncharacterized membrane protein YeaQ/YmgE (transglycosylase-associated protein family)
VLILVILVIGASAGWAAQKILNPGRQVDWGRALTQGLIGSFVGGILSSLLSGDGLAFRMSGILGSIVGAIIVTWVWSMIEKRGQNRT